MPDYQGKFTGSQIENILDKIELDGDGGKALLDNGEYGNPVGKCQVVELYSITLNEGSFEGYVELTDDEKQKFEDVNAHFPLMAFVTLHDQTFCYLYGSRDNQTIKLYRLEPDNIVNQMTITKDSTGYLVKSIRKSVVFKDEVQTIGYVEGVSDGDAYIQNLVYPEAPEGYQNIPISVMYYDTNHNHWTNCVSYKDVSDGVKLVTGGPAYGVAVVVGGVDAYRLPNAQWRAFYMTVKSEAHESLARG